MDKRFGNKKTANRNHKSCGLSILVVDDDLEFCVIISEILFRFGFEVSVAYSVEEALCFLEEQIPDLILADISMPEEDGIALIRLLRSRPEWEQITTVVISARPRRETASVVAQFGASAYLDKPFSIDKLHSTLAPLLPQISPRLH